jgi:predicted SprT family Zn-dependent metalloprotease
MEQKTLQNLANMLWGQYRRVYPKIGTCPEIVVNKRLKTTAGRCFVEHRKIDLAHKFLVSHREMMLEDTLPHELAHQIDFDVNGWPKNNRWHGAQWQKIVLQLGIKTSTYHEMNK